MIWLVPALDPGEGRDAFGYQATLPVLIYGRLFSRLPPEINAIAAIVLVLTVSIGLGAERLLRRERAT